MDWSTGYSASFYAVEVNQNTWSDGGRIEITSGTINRTTDSLRESANFGCVNLTDKSEKWVRVYMDTSQSGTGAHTALFTGLAISPEDNIQGNYTSNTLQCYSVLKPADDMLLERGWYADARTSFSKLIRQLLEPIPSRIEFESEAAVLKTDIVAEAGETRLTMVDRLLSSANWIMRIDGYGNIRIGSISTLPVATFGSLEYDIIENDVTVTKDWYSCPNVFMASNDTGTAVAKDYDVNSPLSIQNRGREVWMGETGVTLLGNETLQDYANRRLKEEQQCIVTASYNRRYVPNVYPFDTVSIRYPAQGLVGDFIVASQSISLGYNARTSEKVTGVAS